MKKDTTDVDSFFPLLLFPSPLRFVFFYYLFSLVSLILYLLFHLPVSFLPFTLRRCIRCALFAQLTACHCQYLVAAPFSNIPRQRTINRAEEAGPPIGRSGERIKQTMFALRLAAARDVTFHCREYICPFRHLIRTIKLFIAWYLRAAGISNAHLRIICLCDGRKTCFAAISAKLGAHTAAYRFGTQISAGRMRLTWEKGFDSLVFCFLLVAQEHILRKKNIHQERATFHVE